MATMVASPLNIAGIFRESIKLPAKNGKLMFQGMLLIFVPFSVLVLLHYLAAKPLLATVEDSYEQSSINEKDVRALGVLELLFLIIFCMFSFIGMVVTVYASALTYNGISVRFMDLILRIKSSWKKPLTAWLYISFLTIIYIFLVLSTILLINRSASIRASYASSWILAILAMLFYLYLATIWALGLVVSVLENDYKGARALGRAVKLLGGQKLKGFLVMMILMLLGFPIYILFYVTLTDDDDELGSATQFAFGFVATLLFCLEKFFTFVVFTVLYYKCKQSCGEKIEMQMERGGYGLVPQELQVNPSLP